MPDPYFALIAEQRLERCGCNTAIYLYLTHSIGLTVYSMSEKASISKLGGQPTGASRDVVGHEGCHTKAVAGIDSLDVFDPLLPVSRAPAVASAAESQPIKPIKPHKTPLQSTTAVSLAVTEPIARSVAEKLEPRREGSPSGHVELIESLRYWESELRQAEVNLQRKAEALAARRKAFAHHIRSQRRDTQQSATTVASSGQPTENTVTSDERLAEMQSQIEMLVMLLRDAWPANGAQPPGELIRDAQEIDSKAQLANELGEGEEAYVAEIDSLKSQVESLVEQNNQLATELAHLTVQRTVDESSDAAASMSWEERRELLYRQFESEDNGVLFNSEQLTSEQCSRLNHEMACMQQELRARESEIAELRSLLEQRPEVQDHELAIGAAAITRLFDDDELIREERSRLKEVQAEWEAKFREMEIAASIARASLARERRQLECQNAELEEQLAHLKQELRQETIAGPTQNRRWFAKLGLGE